jgi:hypothetical protein
LDQAALSQTRNRLAELKASPDCVCYGTDIPVDGKRPFRFSIYGVVSTAEIFVEVTKGHITRVESFVSRHKVCPPEIRLKDLPLVDTADAYELARQMARHCPTKAKQLPGRR